MPEIRLLDKDGQQKGVVATVEGLKAAYDAGLDLVEISPTAKPPVCKIMDYGKFLYEQRKKQSEAQKNQKKVQVKEVKFRPVTEEADYQVKIKKVNKFLESGDKVKVTLRFKGREVTHEDLGFQLLNRVKSDLADFAVVEVEAKKEGRLQMFMLLSPKKSK